MGGVVDQLTVQHRGNLVDPVGEEKAPVEDRDLGLLLRQVGPIDVDDPAHPCPPGRSCAAPRPARGSFEAQSGRAVNAFLAVGRCLCCLFALTGGRQGLGFTTTAAARLHLSPPMLRRALLRALEAVAISDAAAPTSVGVFSMQCLRGDEPQAG